MNEDAQYGVGKLSKGETIAAPSLPYLPQEPKTIRPAIGLIGCGGISEYHLREYKKAGYPVKILCDRIAERAEKRRDEFFPDAAVTNDYREVIDRDDVEVIDAATHPEERVDILDAAIAAQKHVLSQKPFVIDLDEGERLVKAARAAGVKLAVNQNGRWAPHFAYIRRAVEAGLLGDLASIHCSLGWDHSWTADTPFNAIKHLILYDFAIHWFDIVSSLMNGLEWKSVYAQAASTASQKPAPPMLAQAAIAFDGALASLAFNGDVQTGQQDRTFVMGARGSAISVGPDLLDQRVTMNLPEGVSSPKLEGNWFANGFHGTMAELLCAIEDDREPEHSAETNLRSLELCFAAVASAESGEPVKPGQARTLPSS